MPDPVWTGSYNFAQSPEANGFTRWTYDAPVVTVVTTGQAANRRVEVQTDAGGVFIERPIPDLSRLSGWTIELDLACSGPGNAGFEVAVPETYFAVHVHEGEFRVFVADGFGPHVLATPSNAAGCRVRATYDGAILRGYRNGSLVGQINPPDIALPFRRVAFWAEEGGTQAFRTVRWYSGGAVAPG